MSWISALPAWQWAILAAVPIGIVLLYFLKLRRQPVEVPSTYLWLKTTEDLHVNSLLQRLRRSILLLLQLLVVLLAALALLRPGMQGAGGSEDRLVFLLDSSASMQATDADAGANRFQHAKRMIEQRIDTMTDRESAMLVTFSDRAEVLQSFTSDRRRLRQALDRATVTSRPTNVLGALRAADGLANPRRASQAGDANDVQIAAAKPAELHLYSDGGFDPVTEFDLGNLIPTYHAIGTAETTNLAVTAFSAQRAVDDPGEVQAFATVANLGESAAASTATLSIEGELVDASSVELAAGEQTGLSFSLENDEAATLEFSLDAPDDLLVDNRAYAGLSPLRTVSVLVVTEGNTPLRLGLSTPKAAKICRAEFVSPDFLETEAYRQRAAAGRDDLIIYDRCAPPTMPPTSTFTIGALPNDRWQWTSEPSPVVPIDVDRTHPLMRYVELFSLLIFEGRALEGPPGARELVGADAGPVLLVAPRDGYQDLVLGFEIISAGDEGSLQANTNWYAERSWPVFLLNVLRHLAGAAEASGAPSFRPGETVRLRIESVLDRVTVHREGDRQHDEIAPGPSGTIEVVETDAPGNYRVESDDQLVDLFAINLFDRTESKLAAAPAVELGYEEVEAASGGSEQRQEYWRLLLLGSLGVLVAEWWLYARRIA